MSLLGELTAGKDQLEQALALYQPEVHRSLAFQYGQDPRIAALSILAWNVWLLGHPETSAALGERALQEGKELNHAYTLAYATYVGGAAPKYLSRDFDGSRAHVEALLAFSEEQGFPFWLAYGTELRGALLAQEGREEDGILLSRRAAADLDRLGLGWFRPFVPGALAGAHLANGKPERAAPLIARTLARVHETGERWIEPEMHRLRGEAMLLGSGEAIEAELCFTHALDLARSKSAKSWELRAATSLARLWAERGERQRAGDLLTPIHGWFTEGFDTADLKDAKALLDEIR